MSKKEKPLLKQYEQSKATHPEGMLLFHSGNFYTMLGKDAYVAHHVLGTNIVRRSLGGKTLPACGIPISSLEKHATTLCSAGYTVVVCDQIEGEASPLGDVKHRAITSVRPPREGVAPVSPTDVTEEKYQAFTAESIRIQEEKTKAKAGLPPSPEDAVPTGGNVILAELEALDLEDTSPNAAWALLYHWKRTHCHGV